MSLSEARKKIDAIDEKIITLLNRRAEYCRAIGREKIRRRKEIYAPQREKAVLDRIRRLNKGPLSTEAFEMIYREIMSASLALEKPLVIAYLGGEGSFTHMAAGRKFGSQVDYMACGSLLEVFRMVERGECDYGVVPIENSTEGAVTHTFDLLIDAELKICAQTHMEIAHTLMARTDMKGIKKVYSNPQVFGQCRDWLLTHLPGAGQIPVASTTEAARIAVKERGAAAIASLQAAKVYDLRVLRRNIQDIPHNITRFLVIAAQDSPPTGRDRTSIVFTIKDRVGALHAMLTPFVRNKINLTKIESRPSKQKAWDYYFFVDFQGHREAPAIRRALSQLEDMCRFLKILGSYPE